MVQVFQRSMHQLPEKHGLRTRRHKPKLAKDHVLARALLIVQVVGCERVCLGQHILLRLCRGDAAHIQCGDARKLRIEQFRKRFAHTLATPAKVGDHQQVLGARERHIQQELFCEYFFLLYTEKNVIFYAGLGDICSYKRGCETLCYAFGYHPFHPYHPQKPTTVFD